MAPVFRLKVETVEGRIEVSWRACMEDAGAAKKRARRVEIAAKDFILMVMLEGD